MQSNRAMLLCHYRYDPLDRLTAYTPSEQASTQRYYLNDRLATEIQGSVRRSIMQFDDQLLAQQQRQDGAVETNLLATDLQRSVLTVFDLKKQANPLTYTPYGHRPLGNGLLSLLGFNGERPDPVTGWYLLGNGYRAFNPALMCFTSPDSWSPFGEGGLNAYAYSVGDPVNRSDRTGHVSWPNLMAKHFPTAVSAAKKSSPSARPLRATQIQTAAVNTAQRTLNELPNELIDKIASHLPGKNLGLLASTSRRMRDVVYGESTYQKFLKFIDGAKSPQERLLRLDAVGVGSENGIPPKYAIDTSYTRTEALTSIAERNRRHYLPAIERVETRRRAEELERVSSEIRASFGDIW